MPVFDDPQLIDALSAPMGDLISSVGTSVATAQREMDEASLAALQTIYAGEDDASRMLQAIGYRPTWYQIPSVDAEIAVALTVTGESEQNRGPGRRVRSFAAPVDATYSSKYNFELKASSTVRFRIVPIPPSAQADQLAVVPALGGLPLSEARRRLRALDLPLADTGDADDDDKVTAQDPGPGVFLVPGDEISLTFDP